MCIYNEPQTTTMTYKSSPIRTKALQQMQWSLRTNCFEPTSRSKLSVYRSDFVYTPTGHYAPARTAEQTTTLKTETITGRMD